MAVIFHLVSAAWPSEPSCSSYSVSEEPEDIGPHPLMVLKPMCLDFTEIGLQQLRLKYNGKGNSECSLRTVVEVMSCPQVQHISFIPVKPDIPSILYLKRSREDEDLSLSSVYAFHIGIYRYILAVEKVDLIFDLTQDSLRTTLTHLDIDNPTRVERVLNCFQQDKKTSGIALTILERSKHSRTYLWLK